VKFFQNGLIALLCAAGADVSAGTAESPFLQEARTLAAIDGPRLVRLARRVLHKVVVLGNLNPSVEAHHGRRKPAPFGLFVTLVRNRQVRGCFGTMVPTGRSMEALVTEAALGAARFDPRNRPIRRRELADLQIILSFVGPTIPVMSMSEVNPKTMGLLVRAGQRNSVLLPGEAKTAGWQLKRSLRQAGIRRGEPIEMFRFRTVTVYEPRRRR
jgi:AMMECR1 domain-containing protein